MSLITFIYMFKPLRGLPYFVPWNSADISKRTASALFYKDGDKIHCQIEIVIAHNF